MVWLEAFGDTGWPTFHAIDQRLDQYGIDAVETLRLLPAHLLVGWPEPTRRVPAADAPLQLTIAGAAHCPGAADVVDTFITLVRTLADMEKHWPVRSPGIPGLRSGNALDALLDLPYANGLAKLGRLIGLDSVERDDDVWW
ncbi:hypothetical protein [Streptomyces sp. 8N706]|uniref:hypothetical protein n=1 Tax=Streptomyces sp. 8N706 TaxID=3457416 RepID=UPI003FD34E90